MFRQICIKRRKAFKVFKEGSWLLVRLVPALPLHQSTKTKVGFIQYDLLLHWTQYITILYTMQCTIVTAYNV